MNKNKKHLNRPEVYNHDLSNVFRGKRKLFWCEIYKKFSYIISALLSFTTVKAKAKTSNLKVKLKAYRYYSAWARMIKPRSLFSFSTIKSWGNRATHSVRRSISPKLFVLLLVFGLILYNIWSEGAKAGYSFQTNYNSGSYDAFNSLGSPTASTDTAFPALVPGYEGSNSLSYAYDGTSTLKYATASNLPVDKGSIEMKFQKSAYGNAVDQGVGGIYTPIGIYYDASSDYVFVADTFNHRIVKTKIDGTGWQTLGNYGTMAGQFNYPKGISYDSSTGYIYIMDACNTRLVKTKIDGTGWATYGAGSFSASNCSAGAGDGNASTNQLFYDSASEYLYVTDKGNNRIVKTKMDGTGWTAYSNFGGHALSGPTGIFYDTTNSYFYISQSSSHKIIKTQSDGTGWTELAGFVYPQQLHYNATDDFIYVADAWNARIVKTKIDGTGWAIYGSSGSGTGQFSQPSSVFYDTSSAYLYVADTSNKRIVKTQFDGTGWTAYGSYYKNLLKFSLNNGSAFYDSASGYYYIADGSNNRIVKTKMDGTGWQTLGGPSSGGGTNQFNSPVGIAYDSSTEFIYISDYNNKRIIKTKIDGTGWTTYPTTGCNANGVLSLSLNTSTQELFYGIYNSGCLIRLSTDMSTAYQYFSSGYGTYINAFYDDTNNWVYWINNSSQIWRMRYDGSDKESFGSSGSGVGQFSGLFFSGLIKVDPATNYIYVADTGNHRIVRTNWGATDWTTYGSNGSGIGQFNSPKSIQYDSSTSYIYISDTANNRVVKTQIDGTGWQTSNDFTAKEKVLYSAQATDDSRLVYDVLSRKLRFYLAYSNKAQFLETPTLNLTDGQWYTLKANFNKANRTLSIDLDGVEQATISYDVGSAWNDLSFGYYFYIGARSGSTTDRWDGMIDDIFVDTQSIDTTAPTNPTPANTHFYTDSGKTIEFTSGGWGNAATPYITWSGASDLESGLKGYYLYFGTDNLAEPTTTSGVLTPNPGYARLFQTHVGADGAEQNITVPAASLTSGVTYYFRLRTQDNDLNLADTVSLFTYKYDGGTPDPPEYVNVSPVGCSTASTFTFTWNAITDPVSGIAGYQYKNGSAGAVTDAGNVTTLDLAPYQEGDNIAYIRTKDNAGNVSTWQTGVYCSTDIAYVIDGPTVVAGPSSLTVVWVSNKNTTSYVQVYQGNEYVSEQGHTDYSISHGVKVVGLDPATDYRYRLRWLDQSGNVGESSWYQTATSVAPSVSDFKSEIITPTKVLLSWKSSEDASAILSYGVGTADNSINISGSTSTFSQTIDGLQGGTNYVVRIKSTTRDSYTFYSDFYSFATPPLPQIIALRFNPITNQAAPAVRVTWTTNVETTSSVFYGVKGSSKKELSISEKVKDHSLDILNLDDSTTYEIYVTGIDQYGNVATSDINSFQTALDTRPPIITDIVIETSNVGLGQKDTAQIAVSWKTDEAATSQVEYAEGLSGDQYTQKTVEDATLTDSHLVIISDLTPSKPYHLRVVSKDKAQNVANSPDNTVISGEVPKSVLQIILQTLNQIFGWLGKLL